MRVYGLFLLLLLPSLVSCIGLAAMGAVTGIAEAYDAGDCARVIRETDEYQPFFEDRPALLAEASYLKADCLIRMNRETEGYGLMRYIAEQHSDTPYAYQAQARLDARGAGEPADRVTAPD
ncbi:MAG: hypothetical protein NXI30_00205 [bacterium]|nr:hypothetical protein [bacterium]